MQVEIVADVVLVDLDKVFVAFEVAEPADPASARLTIIIIIELIWLMCHFKF